MHISVKQKRQIFQREYLDSRISVESAYEFRLCAHAIFGYPSASKAHRRTKSPYGGLGRLPDARIRLTGELRSKIDNVRNAFWAGGIANPIEVIEQITYLLFIRGLDDAHMLEERKASRREIKRIDAADSLPAAVSLTPPMSEVSRVRCACAHGGNAWLPRGRFAAARSARNPGCCRTRGRE
jgi:hypothetical protein